MAPLIVTMVRHGESTDNTTSLWAGHRDAPLSNHGNSQALRLAKAFAGVPITAIYASDLNRANTTARRVWEANADKNGGVEVPFTTSPLLREQFFGEAEGAAWDAGKYSSAHLPWEDHRAFQIAPHAESLNDVAKRADLVLRHFILPHVLATAAVPPDASYPEQHHIMLFAHGIWLSEMLFSLKRAGDPHVRYVKSGGYANTAWTRIEIELDDPKVQHALSSSDKGLDESDMPPPNGRFASPPAPSEATGETTTISAEEASSIGMSPNIHALLPKLPAVPERHPSLPPAWPHANDLSHPVPKLRHRVVTFAQADHLEGLKRTGRGVGSAAHDEKQRGLKEFFSGGGGSKKAE
ncbi:phosphoglycerate mutase-like protein [Rhodotorula sp. JG-1b]|nr:phosphoglycerate mutase-like protein [Rhodotorula sp. JG-1b]